MEARDTSSGLDLDVPGASAEVDVGVRGLPDEILVLIFSNLTDGFTLLDKVPLVCKQWCRVARDPSSWAAVELCLGEPLRRVLPVNTLLGSRSLAEEARLLLHAPAAASVRVLAWPSQSPRRGMETALAQIHYGPDGCYNDEARRRLRSALRRSRVAVRESFEIDVEGWELAQGEPLGEPEAVVCFLSRQCDLRSLRLYLTSGAAAAALRVISTMRRLETLQLVTAPGVRYTGELAGALPELRELQLNARCPRDESRPHPPFGLLGDLVRGAPALRLMIVDMPQRGPDRDACAALRAVEKVTLNVYQDEQGFVPPYGREVVDAVRAACELSLQMKTNALDRVDISVCRDEHGRYSWGRKSRCYRVVKEFSVKMDPVNVSFAMDGPYCEDCEDEGVDCPGEDWPSSDGDCSCSSDDSTCDH